MQIVPLSGGINPSTMRSNVDLPQPLGPTIATNSRSATDEGNVLENGHTFAARATNPFVRFLTSSFGCVTRLPSSDAACLASEPSITWATLTLPSIAPACT